jgi:hypothetical protein
MGCARKRDEDIKVYNILVAKYVFDFQKCIIAQLFKKCLALLGRLNFLFSRVYNRAPS